MSLPARLAAAFDARPDPAGVPAASISKPVAALVTLQLVAQGKLSLDGDVNEYLTSWRLPTLAQILDGLPPANSPPVRRDGVPGRAHRYSGGGYVLLQQLLEDVTGRPFADLAAELVLGPAWMTTATYAQPDPSATAPAHLEGQPVAWRVHPELATAGLWCAPADLVRFAQALQAAVAGDAGALLPRPPALEMMTPQVKGWGLRLMLSGQGARRRFGHAGGSHGYQCILIGTVFDRKAVAVMTSSDPSLPVIWSLLAAVRDATSWSDPPASEDEW